jgi:hypothetical protein
MGDDEHDGWTYDVGVALMGPPGLTGEVRPAAGDGAGAWLEEAAGRGGQHRRDRRATVVQRGEDAVRAAARVLSSQIA